MNVKVPMLLVLPLVLAACDAPGPRPPVPVNHVHTTPPSSPGLVPTAAPATSAPAATGAPGAGPDRCHTGGVLVSFAGSQGAAGTIVDSFRIANTGLSPCVLYGFVGMLMLDGAGQPLPTHVVRNGGIFSTQAGPSRFVLQPATAATFEAAWSDVTHGAETSCPQAAQLEVTPPDEYDHVVVAVSNWSLAPCGGGEIDVTPIRAAGAGPA